MTTYNYNLTIAIPVRVYGGNEMDKYAQQCLDSISKNAKLRFGEFEVILVDDFSDNGSLDKLDVDSRMNYTKVRNSENLGIGGSRNRAIDMAKGKYVWCIDGDDMLLENWTEVLDCIKEDDGKDIQLYFMPFETITMTDIKNKKAIRKVNKLDLPDYSFAPVTASAKCVRRDKIVKYPEKCYLEDVKWNYQQLDSIDGKDNIRTLSNLTWRYNNYRPTAYTRSNAFLQSNRPSFFQLITQDILSKGNFKDKAISDLLRALADTYDLRHSLKHQNVKTACIDRSIRMFDNIKVEKWSH